MSENQKNDAIRERLAEIAGKCIERRLEKRARALLDASKSKDNGDDALKLGNLLVAASWHRHSLQLLETAASAAYEALELCQDFELDPPDELAGAGWEPVTTHRGVGEGDEGLPDGDPAECQGEKSPAQPEPEPEPECTDPADRDPRPPIYCLSAGHSKLETRDLN